MQRLDRMPFLERPSPGSPFRVISNDGNVLASFPITDRFHMLTRDSWSRADRKTLLQVLSRRDSEYNSCKSRTVCCMHGTNGRLFDIVLFTSVYNPGIDDFGGGGERRQGMMRRRQCMYRLVDDFEGGHSCFVCARGCLGKRSH